MKLMTGIQLAETIDFISDEKPEKDELDFPENEIPKAQEIPKCKKLKLEEIPEEINDDVCNALDLKIEQLADSIDFLSDEEPENNQNDIVDV